MEKRLISATDSQIHFNSLLSNSWQVSFNRRGSVWRGRR